MLLYHAEGSVRFAGVLGYEGPAGLEGDEGAGLQVDGLEVQEAPEVLEAAVGEAMAAGEVQLGEVLSCWGVFGAQGGDADIRDVRAVTQIHVTE